MDRSDELQALAEFVRAHALGWDETRRAKFAGYIELLQRFNAKMNLVGTSDADRIVRELFIDSVAVAAVAPIEAGCRILDVGSGAGLPGIPLAIEFPDASVTLVEPRKKRATFLGIVRQRLDLDNVLIARARIEQVERDRYDLVVSKAFRPPAEWLATAVDWTTPGGTIVCMHASSAVETLREAADELELTEAAHVDVASELGAPVPPGRALTSFRTPAPVGAPLTKA